MRIKGLLLDLGRVIIDFDHTKALQWLSQKTGKPLNEIRDVLYGDNGCAIYHECGPLGISSDEFYREVCRRTGLRETMDDFFTAWKNIFSETSPIENTLDQIAPHVTVGIVSNTDPVHWSYIETLPVMQKFFPKNARVVRSYDVGVRKPHENIFYAGLDAIGCEIRNTLFIDDNHHTVSEFRSLGGFAEQFDCALQPVQRLERILSYYHVLKT